jgi:hypothetical protein
MKGGSSNHLLPVPDSVRFDSAQRTKLRFLRRFGEPRRALSHATWTLSTFSLFDAGGLSTKLSRRDTSIKPVHSAAVETRRWKRHWWRKKAGAIVSEHAESVEQGARHRCDGSQEPPAGRVA